MQIMDEPMQTMESSIETIEKKTETSRKNDEQWAILVAKTKEGSLDDPPPKIHHPKRK